MPQFPIVNLPIVAADFGLHIQGTDFNDTLYGTDGGDWIEGLAGSDRLYGNGGDDSLFGGGGADTLIGGTGNDHLDGGAGNDVLVGGTGADVLIGGEGFDTASYASATSAVGIDLAAGNGFYGEAEGDTFTSVEKVVGSSFDDWLLGDAAGNALEGGAGHDYLVGGAGLDALNGGSGSDTLEGGEGIDVLTGGSGVDYFVFNRNDGPDVVMDFEQGIDKIVLSAGFHSGGFNPFGADGELERGTEVPHRGMHGGSDQVFFDTDDHVLYQLNGFFEPTMLATFANDVQLHTSDFQF